MGKRRPTVARYPEAGETLLNRPLTLPHRRTAAEAVSHTISPISDVRASAEYRRVAGNLLLRLPDGKQCIIGTQSVRCYRKQRLVNQNTGEADSRFKLIRMGMQYPRYSEQLSA